MLACCFWPVETKQLYDPVAYRLEPLLDKRLRDLQPEHVSPAAGQSRLMSSGTCGRPKFLAPCPLSASSVLGVFRSLGVVDPVDIRALRRRQHTLRRYMEYLRRRQGHTQQNRAHPRAFVLSCTGEKARWCPPFLCMFRVASSAAHR